MQKFLDALLMVVALIATFAGIITAIFWLTFNI